MARIRSVSPDICTDQGLVGLTGDAERLYVRLWTHLDDDGRCEDDLLLLKAALFPRHRHIGEDEIAGWLDELVENGQIVRYERGGKRLLTAKPDAWAKFQKPRRKVDSKLPAPTRADIVGTRADGGAQCPTGGGDVGGGEMEMDKEKEGESEGEPDHPLVYPQAVSSPLEAKAAEIAQRAHLRAIPSNHNPAANGNVTAAGSPAALSESAGA